MLPAGVALALLAAFLFGLSALGQKAALPAKLRKRYLLLNKRWLLSVGVGSAGGLSFLAALSAAPLPVVMPLLTASVAVPIVGGALWLKEPLRRRQWLFIALLLAGVALVIL